jgi:hypothetical protein
MKFVLPFCILLISSAARSQTDSPTENIFIFTTDGFRWQEVFSGADSLLINDSAYVQDPDLIKELYWDPSENERRKKLMPFLWNTIARQGRIYGNRNLNNKMDVTNLFKISYPGYNEMLTGYPDPFFVPNIPMNNRNQNILEYLDTKKEYKGRVAAFSSWNIFSAILNKKRSRFISNCGYESIPSDSTLNSEIISESQEAVLNKKHTRYDLLTYLTAREYIEHHKPRVVLIGFGETDEFAHGRQYDLYLQQANNIDKMISELWYYVQTDPFYKNKTTFFITTDHGRGNKNSTWFKHGILTRGSGETWFAVIGPGITPEGEVKSSSRIYQKQIAPTIADLLGEEFISSHTKAEPILLTNSFNINIALSNAGIH